MSGRNSYGGKEIRELLALLEEHGWTIIPPTGGGYMKVRCPCGSHQRMIHKTPGQRYAYNAQKWAERQPCWK